MDGEPVVSGICVRGAAAGSTGGEDGIEWHAHVLWADHVEEWVIPELSLGFKKASSSASYVAQGEVQRALYMYGPKGLAKEN